MSERRRNLVVAVVSLIALGVIAVGLASGPTPPPTPDDRARAIAERLNCPFCAGETLASSQSGVARDLRELIRRRIDEGATDDEILAEFVDRYGESILLDPPARGWGLAVWAAPVVVGVVGVVVVLGLRRPTRVEVGP